MRKTILDRAIAGRKVITYVNGMYSPYNKRSNLYKAINKAGFTLDHLNEGIIDIAIGARRRTRRKGYKMAVVLTEYGENVLRIAREEEVPLSVAISIYEADQVIPEVRKEIWE